MFTYSIEPKRFFIREDVPYFQKDLYERNILLYPEVFADALNVFLFHGKRKIKPYELLSLDTRSFYKEEGITIRKIERDVFKQWKKDGIIQAEFGIENQTKIFNDMPLRLYGYDGARYIDQLRNSNDQNERYPVLSLVLNYSDKRWNHPSNLKDTLKLDEDLLQLVPNINLLVVDMRFLEQDTIDFLTSDLRVIASFLRGLRLKQDIPVEYGKMKHPDEVIGLFYAITGDKTYKEFYEEMIEQKGECTNMCEYLEWYRQRGIQDGITIGKEEGIDIGKLQTLIELVEDGSITVLKAASKLNLSEEEFLVKKEEFLKLKH